MALSVDNTVRLLNLGGADSSALADALQTTYEACKDSENHEESDPHQSKRFTTEVYNNNGVRL